MHGFGDKSVAYEFRCTRIALFWCVLGLRRPNLVMKRTQIGRWCTKTVLVFVRGLRYQSHMPNESIDQLARRLAEAVPQSIKSVRDDLEQNFRTVLNSGLGKLDLVTREEFDVQAAVLQRTRQKLDALEERLAALAAAAQAKPPKKKKTAKKTAKASSKKP